MTGDELEEVERYDRLLKQAADANAKADQQQAEAERIRLETERTKLREEQRKRMGEEAFKRQETQRVERQQRVQQRAATDEALQEIDLKAPAKPKRFRAVDGKFVSITGPSGQEQFDAIVDAELNRLHGDNIKNMDQTTLGIMRERVRQSLVRRRGQLMRRQRREELQTIREEQRAGEQAEQQLKDIESRLKQLNQRRGE